MRTRIPPADAWTPAAACLVWLGFAVGAAWGWLDRVLGAGPLKVLCFAAPAAIVGIDPSEIQIAGAKHAIAASQADFRIGSVTELPFGTGEFDIVVSALVIHFFPDRPKAFREMLRVAKADGIVRDRERLRDIMHVALPAAADGTITYSSRATAFKARSPFQD